MAVLSYLAKRAGSDNDKTTMYIVLGIVFGALALICLLITIYLLARLRRADRRLDRELAATIKNADFAPQFYDKDARPLSHESVLSPPPVPPSPAPPRPVRRPSSLFDRRRLSNTPKLPSSPPPPFPQTPPPMLPPMPSYSVTPAPPVRVPPPALHPEQSSESLVLPTRPESSMSQYSQYSARTALSEAPTTRPGFHRSPSLLRRLLHDRTRTSAPPVPVIPEQHQPQPQTIVEEPTPTMEATRERPMITMSVVSELMPYDLETATPGATPVDVPPPSAATITAPRMPPVPPMPESATTEQDPHSAARLTLLQPPAPLQPRRNPPSLTLHIPNPNTAGTTKGTPPPPRPDGPPPPVPVRSPLRKKPAPLTLAPPDANVDLTATVSPQVLAAFAAKLRPETRDFAVLQDENRLTMQ